MLSVCGDWLFPNVSDWRNALALRFQRYSKINVAITANAATPAPTPMPVLATVERCIVGRALLVLGAGGGRLVILNGFKILQVHPSASVPSLHDT